MVIKARPIYARPLTGQRKIVIGIFGYTRAYVQIPPATENKWAVCKSQEEWDWCQQFSQESLSGIF